MRPATTAEPLPGAAVSRSSAVILKTYGTRSHRWPAIGRSRGTRQSSSVVAMDDASLRVSDADREQAVAALREHLLAGRSEEHTSELQSLRHLVCRLLLEKK